MIQKDEDTNNSHHAKNDEKLNIQSEDESDDSLNEDDDDDDDVLSDYEENERPIDNYKDEINLICDYLNLEYKKEVKFVELKLLYGKFYEASYFTNIGGINWL